MRELKETPKAIDWPRVQIGAETYTLRFSYSSNYQLAKWKKTIETATNVELAACMCGKFDSKGRWKSTGFESPIELADLISELDPEIQSSTEVAMLEAITDALKKAFPALEVTQMPSRPGETAKTDSSDSGPSPLREAV